MLINKSAVKKYVNEHGKRLDPQSYHALNKAVQTTLDEAITICRAYKTLKDGEISHSLIRGKL